MTRDERAAISILNAYKVGYESGMKDLEQQPCRDAISRCNPSCVNCIHKTVCFRLGNFVDSDYAEKCGDFLTESPSVAWIDYRDDGFVECPFCGHATNCEDNIDELHYCFYCGAKMVEPKESEDKE